MAPPPPSVSPSWAQVVGIHFEFGLPHIAKYCSAAASLNDVYSESITGSQFDSLFTDETHTTIKTTTNNRFDIVHHLLDLIIDRFTDLATPGTGDPHRIQHVLTACTMIYYDNKKRRKVIHSASCLLRDLFRLTANAGDTLAHITLSTHHLHFHEEFIPSDFDYKSIVKFCTGSFQS